MKEKINFEGDESWSYTPIDISEFYDGFYKNKSGKILEAGSGVGNNVVIFSKFGFDVTGIEISESRVNIAKQNISKYNASASLLQGDVRSLPFDSESFDHVFSAGVVEHFDGTEEAVQEMFRVLKPGGSAMISVPHRYTLYTINKLLQRGLEKIIRKKIFKAGFEKSYPKNKFFKILNDAGFEITRCKVTEASAGSRLAVIGLTIKYFDKIFLKPFGLGGTFLVCYCKKN